MKTKSPLSDEYIQELGHRLKIIRTFLKLDQKEMSKLLKIGQSQMSKIESGRSAPTIQELTRIKRLAEENDYLRKNLSCASSRCKPANCARRTRL